MKQKIRDWKYTKMDMLNNKIINSSVKYGDRKKLLPKENDDLNSVESQKSSIAAEKMVFGGKNGKLPVFSPAERAKECYIYQINGLSSGLKKF